MRRSSERIRSSMRCCAAVTSSAAAEGVGARRSATEVGDGVVDLMADGGDDGQ